MQAGVATVKLVALDIAILPPAAVAARAVALSAAIPSRYSSREPAHGRLRLDDEHLPHVTLSQHYVRETELEGAFAQVDTVLAAQQPLPLTVSGGGRSRHTLWMTVTRTPELLDLHERLMAALRGWERPGGTPDAFFERDARVRDVLWVAGFRLHASFGVFTPHITLGHGDLAPAIEPMAFEATTVAACHLGRFCTCRSVLRAWNLKRT